MIEQLPPWAPIQKLHELLTNQIELNAVFSNGDERTAKLEGHFIKMALSYNTEDIFSDHFYNHAVTLFTEDEDFQTVLRSTSTNLQFWMQVNDLPIPRLTRFVIESVSLSKDLVVDIPANEMNAPFAGIELHKSRFLIWSRLPHLDKPINHWYITLCLFMLTVNESSWLNRAIAGVKAPPNPAAKKTPIKPPVSITPQ